MNDLSVYQQSGLPAKPIELAKFILVAPEKVKAMQAEIRAIQKAQLAKEVYDQKKAELDRLRELMLLAYQRMGEITREMPKASGGDRRSENFKVPAKGNFEKPKSQVIQDLGFSTSQVGRMEQIAAHPDIVEEVIAESQAGQTEATQGEVLRRIKERNNCVIDLTEAREEQFHSDMAQIDRDYENLKKFRKAVTLTGLREITEEVIESVVKVDAGLDATINGLGDTIQFLTVIKCKLTERRVRRGKTNFYARDQGLHFR